MRPRSRGRNRLPLVVVVFWSLVVASRAAAAEEPPSRPSGKTPPNIVVIVIDELGYYELSCMGHPILRTPHIDRMAAEGMRFTQALAGGCVCAPTRSTLMTGKHLGHTTVRDNPGGTPLKADDFTVADMLRRAGYATGGFGKWGLGDRGTTGVPERHGFDIFFGYYHQVHAHTFFPKYLLRNSELIALPGNTDAYDDGETFSQYRIFDEALRFIRENKDRPFFAYLPWTPPHGRWGMPENDPSYQLYKNADWARDCKNPRDAIIYAAMVNLVDRQVGAVLDLLKQLDLDERTIVFFSGDNGGNPYFADEMHPAGLFGPNVDPKTGKRFRGGKGNLYEGGLRIPMIVRWPGRIAPGTVSDHLWYFPDMMPTLAELAGAEAPSDTDGISIVPTLLGPEAAGRPQARHEYLYWESAKQTAVRSGQWKLIRQAPQRPWELYDLHADVEETRDVADEHPEVVERLARFAQDAHEPNVVGEWLDRSKGFRPAPGVSSYQP